MVDTYEMKRKAEDLQANAQYIAENIDELVEQAECWETIENQGWGDAGAVIEALEKGAAWAEFADNSGLDLEEAESLVSCKDELEAMVDVFSVAAGRGIDDHEDAQAALEIILSKGKEAHPGVVAAITLLVEALQEASILPRTEAVPAASNNTESTNTHSTSATNEVEFSPGDSVTTNPVTFTRY